MYSESRSFMGICKLEYQLGNFSRARTSCEQALLLMRKIKCARGEANAIKYLGKIEVANAS